MSNDVSLDINPKSNPVQTVAPPKEDNNMLRATDKITALYCRLSVEDTKEKGGKSSVAGALADFQKSAGGAGGGGGGEGDGPGGGGIYDVYMGQVILAVRPNWSMPTYSRANLSVQVNVKLDPNGKVLSCTVARSSGRAEVDASAVNAVIRTKVLPAPPTPDQQELLLTFNTQEMMGRR